MILFEWLLYTGELPQIPRPVFRAAVMILPLCGFPLFAQSSLFTIGGAFPVGSGSASEVSSANMVTADFNHDGKADIATLNTNDRTITLLFGDGTGGFTPAPSSSPISASGMTAMATGDFNGDGIPDLALTGVFGTEVLLGDGAGMFTKASGLTGAYSNFSGAVQLSPTSTATGSSIWPSETSPRVLFSLVMEPGFLHSHRKY